MKGVRKTVSRKPGSYSVQLHHGRLYHGLHYGTRAVKAINELRNGEAEWVKPLLRKAGKRCHTAWDQPTWEKAVRLLQKSDSWGINVVLIAPQDGPRPQDGPKESPKWSQQNPNLVPNMAQDGPRWPQEVPRWPHEDPRWPQVAPRWPQPRLGINFGSILAAFWDSFWLQKTSKHEA